MHRHRDDVRCSIGEGMAAEMSRSEEGREGPRVAKRKYELGLVLLRFFVLGYGPQLSDWIRKLADEGKTVCLG